MRSTRIARTRSPRCLSFGLAGAWLAACVGLAAGQTIEYTITDIPPAPGAYSTLPVAINDQAVVVGLAQYPAGGPFLLRGWRWSAAEGMTLLPPPPGAMSRYYEAVDINEFGVIAGDGGYDNGQVWRFENGTYTIIGSLSGLTGSRGPAMNRFGHVVATAFNPSSFLTPTRALLFTNKSGIVELFPEYTGSGAADINDAGQIAATGGGIAIRVEPDGTRTFLPVPQGFVRFSPARINAAGDIAGIAACSHECNQAFLWTEQGGFQAIATMGTRHSLGGLNDRREVVGGVEEGIARGWVWSPDRGLRSLTNVIDPAETSQIWYAFGINNLGQIIAYGADISGPPYPRRIMLLTPIGVGVPGDINGDGVVNVDDVEPFVRVLIGTPLAPEHVARSDLNGDGAANGLDTQSFVGLLVAP